MERERKMLNDPESLPEPQPEPSSKGGDGRNAKGQFAKGWKGGPGNPFGKRVSELRSALFQEVREKDIRAVIRSLIKGAKGGDVAAAKVLFDRVFGRVNEDALFFLNGGMNNDEVEADLRYL